MKRIFTIGLIGLLFVVAVAGAQTLTVTPEQGGIYSMGEEAQWSISLTDDGAPLNGEVNYTLKAGGLRVLEEGVVQIKEGAGTMKAVGTETGTLLLELKYGGSKAFGGAVFDWPEIQPSAPEPEDFDEFWQDKIAELEAVPMDVVLEKIEMPDDIEYWKITMGNIRGSKIHGQIAKPKNSTGKLPAMLKLQWAGIYPLRSEWVTGPAGQGWLAMNIIAHDLPIDREVEFYKELKAGGYPTIGKEDRDTSYFLRMYLSCYRAVEYLLQRPDWDGKVLHVTGASQGGLQSVMVAGLHPAVTAVTANIPAGCDHTGELVNREPGWPKWYRRNSGSDRALEACKYYDVVNFARRVKCPTLVGSGLVDTTCPPAGVIAMFNQLAGPKRLVVMPISGHSGRNNAHGIYEEVAVEWSAALKAGEPVPMK